MEAEDLAIFADVVRVEQIFWNLASNALKFTPPRGTVHLRLSRDGSWASLEVRDPGRGIDPNFLGHVFGMFQQGDHKPTNPDGLEDRAVVANGCLPAHSVGLGDSPARQHDLRAQGIEHDLKPRIARRLDQHRMEVVPNWAHFASFFSRSYRWHRRSSSAIRPPWRAMRRSAWRWPRALHAIRRIPASHQENEAARHIRARATAAGSPHG